MTDETVNIEGAVCAPPLTHNEQIVMGHGAGGRMSHQLIQKAFVSAFQNTALNAGDDAALVDKIARGAQAPFDLVSAKKEDFVRYDTINKRAAAITE